MKTNTISVFSRILCVLAAVALVVSIFVPLWRIELDAPQYPEGLALLIYPNNIGGDVQIINGLNHYIGMQTLHSENFIEFTLLPYIIGAYALLALLAAILGRRRFLNFVLGAFIVFGIVSMADFWRWEYNYGHNLDPNAAIIVPGMAYQPPLIGFKQLLNFGAYSIPDIGGWLFIAAGLLLLIAVLKESGVFKKKLPKKPAAAILMLSMVLTSCHPSAPEVIHYGTDKCEHCKMTIVDAKFAASLLTVKGRTYKFDDLNCLLAYSKSNPEKTVKSRWVGAFDKDGAMIEVKQAIFVKSELLKSPMRGDVAAFSTKQLAEAFAQKLNEEVVIWDSIGK